VSLVSPFGTRFSAHGSVSPLSKLLGINPVGEAAPVGASGLARLRDSPLFAARHFRSRGVALGGQYDLSFDPSPFSAPSGTTQTGETVRLVWVAIELGGQDLATYGAELATRAAVVGVSHHASLVPLLPGDPKPRHALVQLAVLAPDPPPVRVTLNLRALGIWAQVLPLVT
jgi:hypothetical protein